jgi:hypothetical protein
LQSDRPPQTAVAKDAKLTALEEKNAVATIPDNRCRRFINRSLVRPIFIECSSGITAF